MTRKLKLRVGLANLTLITCAVATAHDARADHGDFLTTTGVYRVPFADDVSVFLGADHHDHGGPNGNKNRMDMNGVDSDQMVTAAAGGWIRAIVDFNGNTDGLGDGVDKNGAAQDDTLEHSCTDLKDEDGNRIVDSVVTGLCQDYNNYVWIEHPNGEWSKYTHMKTGSVTGNAWVVGDWINAGDIIGEEGDIGAATGRHLHHEMALPTDPSDPTPFSTLGGFVQGTNIVPVICDIPDNTYESGATYVANPCINQVPVADAGGPYVVDEGSPLALDATGSSDPDGTPLVYLWSPADALDDAKAAQPNFDTVDDSVVAMTLTVFDQTEAIPVSANTTVTVLNVAPSVVVHGDSIDEGATATVFAEITDPGVLDTHTVTIDWGDGTQQNASVDQMLVGVDHTYGDNGDYEVTIEAIDDDGGVGSDSVVVSVGNLSPSLVLDTSGEIPFPGGDYQVVEADASFVIAAQGSDVGSDDLVFHWSTGEDNTFFNDGVAPDAVLSPFGTFPFQAGDATEFSQSQPGVATLSLVLADDDGGEDGASSDVIVTGTQSKTEGSGWWKHEFSNNGNRKLSADEAAAYRDIVNAVSSVFSESTAANNNEDMHDILSPWGGDKAARARADLMLTWLSFASGAVGWDATVPLGPGDDIAFLELMFDAEAVILDPDASDALLGDVEHDLGRVRFAD